MTIDTMEFRVLGPLDVRLGGETLALGGGKQRAVLAVLLLRAGEVVSVERLVDEVWGDDPPPSAAHTLESYVSRLRQLFNGHGPRLVRRGAGYALELGDATLDTLGFAELQERASLAAAMEEHPETVELTALALAMWRGPALADVALASAGRAEADRLEELRLRTYELRFDAELALGRHEQAIGELQKLVAQNPYRERFVAQLMLALYRAGRHAEALDVYERLRRSLDDDLGLQPSSDLQQLSGQIVRQDADLRWRGAAPSTRAVPLIGGKARRLTSLVAVGAGVAAVMAFTASGSTPHPPNVAKAPVFAGTSPIVLILPEDNPEPWVNPKLTEQVRTTVGSSNIRTEVLLAPSRLGARERERIQGRIDEGGFGLALVFGNSLSRSLAPVAREVTRTRFVFFDASLTELSLEGAANATGAPFGDEQSTELVGYLSGLAPRRGGSGKADVVSVVLGVRSPHAERVAQAFRRGVRRARPGVRVRVDYANEVVDPTACELMANDQIDAGSDIVLADAGSCGLGALAVARLRGVWGVGGYEDGVVKGPHILALTYKDWFKAVNELLTDYHFGRLVGGADNVLDLNDDYAVGIDTGSIVSESMWSKVTKLCSKIRIASRDESGHRNGMLDG